MLKLFLDKDANLFPKKNNLNTLKMARYIQILCLSTVTLNLKNRRNVFHIIIKLKLSKYCDIDVRLVNSKD